MTPIFWAALAAFLAAFLSLFFWNKKRAGGALAAIQARVEEEEGRANLLLEEIARLEQKEKALRRKKERFFRLRGAIRGWSFSSPFGALAQQVVLRAAELLEKGDSALLFLLRDAGEHFELAARRDAGAAEPVSASWMDLFNQWILTHRQPLLIEDVEKEYRLQVPPPLLQNPGFPRSLVAAPLVSEDKIMGVLAAVSPRKKEFSTEDLRLLAILTSSAALLLSNARLYEETERLAHRDGLTRLFQPRYFNERLEDLLRAARDGGGRFSVLMLDVDHFREVNNRHGHLVGDALLVSLAGLLRKFCPQEAVVSRYGGEEFAVLLPGYDKREAAEAAGRLLREIAAAKLELRRQQIGITASAGVASFPEDGLQREELIGKADRALYRAKNGGRNRVERA